MKKIIEALVLILLIVGCNNNREIKLINEVDENYFTEDMPDNQATPKIEKFSFFLNKEFIGLIKETTERNSGFDELYILNYIFYINEKGFIDKLQMINRQKLSANHTLVAPYLSDTTSMVPKIKQEELNKEITKKLLIKMRDWEFTPAILNNKSVPMRKEIDAQFLVSKSGKNDFDIIAIKQFQVSFKSFSPNDYFVAVEQMPQPIGGIAEIQNNIIYPENEKRAGIEGRVYVKAYIDSNGSVVKAEIIRGIGGGCDEAAMEAVKNVKFTSGIQNGKRVNVQVTVPILFKLH